MAYSCVERCSSDFTPNTRSTHSISIINTQTCFSGNNIILPYLLWFTAKTPFRQATKPTNLLKTTTQYYPKWDTQTQLFAWRCWWWYPKQIYTTYIINTKALHIFTYVSNTFYTTPFLFRTKYKPLIFYAVSARGYFVNINCVRLHPVPSRCIIFYTCNQWQNLHRIRTTETHQNQCF